MAATTEAETTSATATVVALWPHAWRSQRRLGRARGPTRPHGPAVQLQLQTIISVRGKCASGKHAPAPPALHTPHPKGDMTCRGGGAQHASQPARGTTSTRLCLSFPAPPSPRGGGGGSHERARLKRSPCPSQCPSACAAAARARAAASRRAILPLAVQPNMCPPNRTKIGVWKTQTV